jgi:uncharacterized protein (DUF1778 family)
MEHLMTSNTEISEPTEVRKQIIRVLTTNSEKDEIRLAAAHTRKTVATFTREAALKEAREQKLAQTRESKE